MSMIPTTTEPDVADRLLATSLAHEIEFLTARARSIGNANANRSLAALGLSVRSYSVLSLACSDHEPSQRELADFISLNPSQIVALVDQLAARGLVTRRQDARDRRSNGIAATDEGRALHAEAHATLREAENTHLAALSHDEREQLRTLLRKVAFAPLG